MLLYGKHLIITLTAILVLCISATLPAQEDQKQNNELESIAARLVKDGFDQQKIDALFSKKEIFFTTRGVSIFFSYFESAPSYHQFLEKKSIAKAARYVAENKETLELAEKIYGVDKTVITAILLVETRLGNYLGKYTTINMLASIAALGNETLKERIWKNIPKKAKPEKQKFTAKVNKRKDWAYNELKAFIKYTDRENIAPETVKGSFAGAIGICQFMPSNALSIARDGNNDGKIDLFSHQDAIFSIANYLKRHGWKPNLSRQQQYDVIYTYNHSNYYVDTIQKVSDKLKER